MSINVAIIKPADNGCNLHCKYCYADGQPDKINFMSIETAKRIVDELFQQAEKRVTFLWHGGEPMLRGLDFFAYVFDYQKQVFKNSNIEYRNAIQTNLTLFDEKWAVFLKEHKITISTSLDGTRELHNKNRIFSNGQGSYDKLVDNIKLAQSYGIKTNALCVISQENLDCACDICSTLNELNISHVGFLPCFKKINDVVVYPSLKPSEFGNFMIEMFDLYLSGIAKFDIREFEQIMKACFNKTTNTCSFSGECSKFISINSRGIITPCDTVTIDEENILGNIFDESLKSIILSDKYKKLMFSKKLSKQCLQCNYLKFCYNGCPTKQDNGKYYFCEDRKMMFNYVQNILLEIINNVKGEKTC